MSSSGEHVSGAWSTVEALTPVLRAEYSHGPDSYASSVAIGLGGGELLLISPPGGGGAEALLDELAGRGRVTALLAPNGFHRMGVPLAAERFPEARVFAPEGAEARVAEVTGGREVEPLAALQPLLPQAVELFVSEHARRPDLIGRVRVEGGTIWYLNDLILNFDHVPRHPLLGPLLWLMGYRAGMRVNRFGARFVLLRDRAAFKAWLLEELERLPPVAVVFGHGAVVTEPELLARLPEVVREGL